MTFEQALAVYLYLQFGQKAPEDEKVLAEAWKIICNAAEPLVMSRR